MVDERVGSDLACRCDTMIIMGHKFVSIPKASFFSCCCFCWSMLSTMNRHRVLVLLDVVREFAIECDEWRRLIAINLCLNDIQFYFLQLRPMPKCFFRETLSFSSSMPSVVGNITKHELKLNAQANILYLIFVWNRPLHIWAWWIFYVSIFHLLRPTLPVSSSFRAIAKTKIVSWDLSML